MDPQLTPQQNTPQPLSFQEKLKLFIHSRKKLIIFSIVGVIVLISLSAGIYFILAKSGQKAQNAARPASNSSTLLQQSAITPIPTASAPPAPTPTLVPIPTVGPLANWYTYVDPQYKYSIKYPNGWTAVNIGSSDTKVPSVVAFGFGSASGSARLITISVSTRTYQEQLVINGSAGSPLTVGSLSGIKQTLQTSDGTKSENIILQGNAVIYIFNTQQQYSPILDEMVGTFTP